MVGKLSKRSVDALAPGTILWDRELPRFGVKVSSGGAKSYIVQYRALGRVRRYTLGRHGAPWTPDTARAEALHVLAAVARGADPAGAKIGGRTAPTVADLLDRFLTEHVEAKCKPGTAREYRRLGDALIRPALGPRRLADVTRADVARLHHRHRSTPYQANRLLAVIGKMFTLAERWGLRPDGTNPCRHVEKFREARRTRRLSPEELGRLGAALDAAERGPLTVPADDGQTATATVSPLAVAAIRLLLLTGARRGEILGARWEDLDHEGGVLRLRDSKTGPKDVLLPAPALAVVNALPRVEGCPYLIPGARPGRPLVNLAKPWAALTAAARLEGLRPHDLRHAFASVGVDVGLSLPVVGKLLGHTQPATTSRYAHVEDPVRAAGELVAGRIAAALGGGT